MGTACSKLKQQKSAVGHMCISDLLIIDWLVNNIILSCIITGDKKCCLHVNIWKRKEWLSLNNRATPRIKIVHIHKR